METRFPTSAHEETRDSNGEEKQTDLNVELLCFEKRKTDFKALFSQHESPEHL